MDAAINHYIEAGSAIKAIDAAMRLGLFETSLLSIEDGTAVAQG